MVMTLPAVRRCMQANRSKDTKPEVKLRRLLWSAGLRGWRKHVSRLPGKPDVAWIGLKIAVFLNGCFWHGCPKCTAKGRTPIPQSNHDYWLAKRARTIERQAQQTAQLESMGWTVCIVWECEFKEDPGQAIETIRKAVSQARSRKLPSPPL